MKVDLKKFKPLFKKQHKHNKNKNKKPSNRYNNRGEGGKAHWPAHGRRDAAVLC